MRLSVQRDHNNGCGRGSGVTAPDQRDSRVPRAFLDELLTRTSMPALIGTQVRLEPACNGRVWKAGCPYHDDDGTSFYVYDHGFHCFGCGAHGNAIDFVMRSGSIPFDEAIQSLAEAAQLNIPRPDRSAGAGGGCRSFPLTPLPFGRSPQLENGLPWLRAASKTAAACFPSKTQAAWPHIFPKAMAVIAFVTIAGQPEPRIAALIEDVVGAARACSTSAQTQAPTSRRAAKPPPWSRLPRCTRNARLRHLPTAIDAVAEDLPFPDGSFDAIMATFTVHQRADPDADLAETDG